MIDYYSMRHGNKQLSKSSSPMDYYAERHQNKIPPSEGFLKRAMRMGSKAVSEAITPEPARFNPKNPFLSSINALTGFENVPGLGALQSAERARGSLLEDASGGPGIGSSVLNIATDPLTWLGGGGAGKEAIEDVGKIFPYTSKKARVKFTKGVENSLKRRRAALSRGYGSALDKSYAVVDLGDIEKGLGLPEIKGAHTLREAQELKNSLTTLIPESIKSGAKISPKYLNEQNVASEITRRMIKADPKIAPVIEKYAKHAENYKSAVASIRSSRGTENIFGSNLIKQMFGAGGSIPEKAQVALEEFAPRVSKSVHGAKINENIFRGLRGATIGGLASKFVPSFLKRALLSEATK